MEVYSGEKRTSPWKQDRISLCEREGDGCKSEAALSRCFEDR